MIRSKISLMNEMLTAGWGFLGFLHVFLCNDFSAKKAKIAREGMLKGLIEGMISWVSASSSWGTF